ncbi:MAG: hypothetical protein KatS3mg104_0692 [Phycisphaerae bacterium]|nr:MAG: hypothetical protein KatS3mg104_0692 [Phycisphaerae bacterium]
MENALRNRLTFGPIMLIGLFGLLWLDYAVQQWTLDLLKVNGISLGIGGVGLLVLLLGILPLATYELAQLFAAERVRPYRVIASAGSGLLILHAFATQFPEFRPYSTSVLAFIVVFVMLLAALVRAIDQTNPGSNSTYGRNRPSNTLPRRVGMVFDGDSGENRIQP